MMSNIVALCFLPPLRLIVTTSKGFKVPLDKINVFLNSGSY